MPRIPDSARTAYENKVRIGPISVIALVIIISIAVLAVLAISTAHASLTVAKMQADSLADTYANETAAQQFVAELDDAVKSTVARNGNAADAMPQVQAQLPIMLEAASDAAREAGYDVQASADVSGRMVNAEFSSGNARNLSITVTVRDDGTYYIEKWKVAAVHNEEQPAGNLWSGN